LEHFSEEKLNNDDSIDGILVQLPLPKHIDELEVINAISAEKDVDGFHTTNIGKMMIGDETGFLPCTPFGVIQMFEEYDIELTGKDIVVIGQSNIVGKPMSLLLMQKHATVQTCNSRTKNLSEKLQMRSLKLDHGEMVLLENKFLAVPPKLPLCDIFPYFF